MPMLMDVDRVGRQWSKPPHAPKPIILRINLSTHQNINAPTHHGSQHPFGFNPLKCAKCAPVATAWMNRSHHHDISLELRDSSSSTDRGARTNNHDLLIDIHAPPGFKRTALAFSPRMYPPEAELVSTTRAGPNFESRIRMFLCEPINMGLVGIGVRTSHMPHERIFRRGIDPVFCYSFSSSQLN